MGTSSLVFGIILIIVGSGFGVLWLLRAPSYFTESGLWAPIVAVLIFTVPMFAIGGFLLRKYDRDKKKEKNS